MFLSCQYNRIVLFNYTIQLSSTNSNGIISILKNLPLKMAKQYMIRFTNELLDFRIPEFTSLADYFGFEINFVVPPTDKPYIILATNNEECLLKLLHRSVLAQSIYELWASADTYDEFYKQLTLSPYTDNPYYSNCSFRILVETFGKKISLADKVERIEKLDFLPFQGVINLKTPDVTFHYYEYFGRDQKNVPDDPFQIIFGRWIADSNNRKDISKFSLKTRKFIANTTMEPTLAFLMSNIAKVGPNDLVYDPFVGSGSLLVSAAFLGAFICGSDIDYQLLHGLAKPSRCGEKKRSNDESVRNSSLSLLKNDIQFDAIVTDPPYGKREARERIGTRKNYTIPEELVEAHIPSKFEYKISDIYTDLLNFSAKHLKMNGRILFWAPYSSASEEIMPNLDEKQQYWPEISFFPQRPSNELENELQERFTHSQLKFISYSKQYLTHKYCRILIAMERIC